MPEFKDYSAEGELLSVRNEPLNETNLERFIKQYSPEFVQGYLACLSDDTKVIREILGGYCDGPKDRKLFHLIKMNEDLLESDRIKKLIQDATPNSGTGFQAFENKPI